MKQKGSLALYIPEIVLGKQYWSRVRRFERGFMTVPSWMRPDFTGKDIYDRLGDGMSLVGVDDWDFDKNDSWDALTFWMDGVIYWAGLQPIGSLRDLLRREGLIRLVGARSFITTSPSSICADISEKELLHGYPRRLLPPMGQG